MNAKPSLHQASGIRALPLPWLLLLASLLLSAIACTTVTDLFGRDQGAAEILEGGAAVPEIEEGGGEVAAEPTPTETVAESGTESGSLAVGSGSLDVEEVNSTAEGEISGPIIRVQVTNPTDGEVVAEIPCGLIFEPAPNSDEQRMMTIQSDSKTIAPGGSAELTPYVICIDGDRAGPGTGSTYLLGEIAAGELGAFADCLCQQDLETTLAQDLSGGLGLQFAIWMTSEGRSPDDFFGEIDYSQLPIGEDEFSEMFGEEFADMLSELQGMQRQAAEDWLSRCGIEPGS